MGLQWEADMASPLLPAKRENPLDIKVGGDTLRNRLADTVDMAEFFYDADRDGRGQTVFSDVDTKLATYVRSEGQRTTNEARQQAMSDVVSYYEENSIKRSSSDGEPLAVSATKTWDATLDDKTRTTHIGLNGTTVAWDEYFWTVNGAALYPGGFNIPEEDINCRCVIRCNISGNIERVSDKKSYEAWLEEVMENGIERT